MSYAFFNNDFIAEKDLRLHISDLALHRAYGIFDFFKLKDGKNPWIAWYLDRFYRSLQQSFLHIPYDKSQLISLLDEMIKLNDKPDCCIKLLVTGGYASDGYSLSDKNNFIILPYPEAIVARGKIDNGIKLISSAYQRSVPSIKTIDYFYSVVMSPKIKEAGAEDILYYNHKSVSETSRCNIFMVKNGALMTPIHHILEGITRRRVLSIDVDIPMVQTDIPLSELLSADEVFITSTTKGIFPVIQIDDTHIADGKPGQVTKRLSDIIQQF